MRVWKILLALCLCVSLVGCKEAKPQSTSPQIPEDQGTTLPEPNQLTLIYTNDVGSGYLRNDDQGVLGYAAVAAYRNALEDEGKTVVLLDGGNIDGRQDLLELCEYTVAVPGDEDLKQGVEALLSTELPYTCCNLLELETNQPVFPAYRLETYGNVTVGFVGITRPVAVEAGYGFEKGIDALCQRVQAAIDQAKQAGADYVIAIAHVGIEPTDSPYTTVELLGNTEGLTAYLDGHSHSWISGETVRDLDDRKVPLFANPEGLTSFACITVDLNTGAVSGELVTRYDEDVQSIANAAE